MAVPNEQPYFYSHRDAYRLDPDPLYAKLRSEQPMARVKMPYGRESWLVTRYQTVKAVLGDPRFSRAAAACPEAPRSTPIYPRPDALLGMDPPDHTRIRRVVNSTFTVRRVERLRPRAQQIVDSLLDEIEEKGAPADLVSAYATPLPITIICEILGVPAEDRHMFRNWSIAQMSTTAFSPDEISGGHESLRDYLTGLIMQRRKEPTDDLLGRLVRARDVDGRLSEDELVTQAVMLLTAGYETTANMLANFAYTLLTHPDQLAWLRADLSKRIRPAVEEMLRFVPLATGAPASQGHSRMAKVDVELEGVLVRAGEPVLPAVNSANRDECVFANASQLDLSRRSNRHIAFGYGPHRCLGAHLARMELQVATGALLRRFPGLRMTVSEDEVEWKKGMLVRGPKELLVTW